MSSNSTTSCSFISPANLAASRFLIPISNIVFAAWDWASFVSATFIVSSRSCSTSNLNRIPFSYPSQYGRISRVNTTSRYFIIGYNIFDLVMLRLTYAVARFTDSPTNSWGWNPHIDQTSWAMNFWPSSHSISWSLCESVSTSSSFTRCRVPPNFIGPWLFAFKSASRCINCFLSVICGCL